MVRASHGDWLSPLLEGLAILNRGDEGGRPSEDSSSNLVIARERRSVSGAEGRKHSALEVGDVLVENRKRGTQNKRHRR